MVVPGATRASITSILSKPNGTSSRPEALQRPPACPAKHREPLPSAHPALRWRPLYGARYNTVSQRVELGLALYVGIHVIDGMGWLGA